MAKTSPTSRSLALMRERGYLCEVVERFNPWSKTRHDLFGFIDILCIKEGQTVAIQTTTRTNVSARVKKINELESAVMVLEAGWKIIVHGWHKKKDGWCCKEVEIIIQ